MQFFGVFVPVSAGIRIKIAMQNIDPEYGMMPPQRHCGVSEGGRCHGAAGRARQNARFPTECVPGGLQQRDRPRPESSWSIG